jgi:DNA helicase-2/ATP-dependent DNA helicase PcrA
VYFIGCNDSIIPHARAEDIGEEHRLFYVAVTRARDVLKVSAVASIAIGNKIVPVSPSQFAVSAGLFLGGNNAA